MCFSSHNLVEVQGKGATRMEHLQIGDFVQTNGGGYSEVYSFLHKDNDRIAPYLQIYTATAEAPLEVSAAHMISLASVGGQLFVRADSVNVGDVLSTVDNVVTTVTAIEHAYRRGLFAPLTYTGDISVGGILASNYISVFSLSHSVTHASMAPRRWFCHLRSCEKDAYNENGIATWCSALVQLIAWLLEQQNGIQTAFLALLLHVFALLFWQKKQTKYKI